MLFRFIFAAFQAKAALGDSGWGLAAIICERANFAHVRMRDAALCWNECNIAINRLWLADAHRRVRQRHAFVTAGEARLRKSPASALRDVLWLIDPKRLPRLRLCWRSRRRRSF